MLTLNAHGRNAPMTERRLLRSCQGNQRFDDRRPCQERQWKWSTWSTHHLRPRRPGHDRKFGGPLKSGRTTNEFYFFPQGVSLTGNGGSFVSDGEVVNSTPHRARITHANILSRLKRLSCIFLCAFLKSSSRAHVTFRALLYPAFFSLQHDTPTSASPLYPSNRTNPCAPQSGLLFGRVPNRARSQKMRLWMQALMKRLRFSDPMLLRSDVDRPSWKLNTMMCQDGYLKFDSTKDDDEDDEVAQNKLLTLVAKDVKTGTYAATCLREK